MAQIADQPENPRWQFSLQTLLIAVTVASPFLLLLRFPWGGRVSAVLGFTLVYFYALIKFLLWFGYATKATKRRVWLLVSITLIAIVLLPLLFGYLMPAVESPH